MPRFRHSNDQQTRREFSAIQDATTCKAWLATFAAFEGAENLRRVAEFIGDLMEGPLAPARKYEMIDRVRVGLYGAARERVHDNDLRNVPLTAAEAESVWALIDTLEDLREAYELLITRLANASTGEVSAAAVHEAGGAPTKVMALHRALDLNAHVLVLYLRMRVAVPERLWDQHCRMGQLARQLGCQNEKVDDPLRASLTDTCREAFNIPLLLALSDPTMLSQQEFQTAYTSSSRWAGKVGYRIDSATELGSAPVRPASNPGPVIQLCSNEHQVRLDTQRALKSIERRLDLLESGSTPQSVGLGDGVSAATARALLRGLVRRWGAIMPESIDFPEQLWRPSPSEFALAVTGLSQVTDGLHRQGTPTAPASTYEYHRMRDDALTRSHGEIERARIERLLEDAETWSVAGETADSVLCMRRHFRPRLSLGQLIGLKLGGKVGPIPFLLGSVQGLQQGINDNSQGVARPASTHLVRVKLIPGLPQAVRAAVDQIELQWVYLLVPNTPAANDEAIWEQVRADPENYSLVLPLASFRPARTMRVVARGLATALRLEELITRGLDFDHVRFKLV